LRADTSWVLAAWVPAFLAAHADEAEDGLQLLQILERAWFAARRSTSRAAAAIDVMAAAPSVSATSLGRALKLAGQRRRRHEPGRPVLGMREPVGRARILRLFR
jgi:hypothetical protein